MSSAQLYHCTILCAGADSSSSNALSRLSKLLRSGIGLGYRLQTIVLFASDQLLHDPTGCTAMNSVERFTELTEGQKMCLRLVNNHHTSKEIARILGISSFTVDQRLDAARRKLNAESRREAAKIFASLDQNISQPLVYETQPLEPEPMTASSAGPPNRAVQIFSRFPAMISVPPIGGERHELSKSQVIVQSLTIAFFSTLVVATIAIMLMGTMRLFG